MLIIVYVFSYVSCPRIVGIGNGYMCSQFMYLRSKYIDRCSADILKSNYIDIRWRLKYLLVFIIILFFQTVKSIYSSQYRNTFSSRKSQIWTKIPLNNHYSNHNNNIDSGNTSSTHSNSDSSKYCLFFKFSTTTTAITIFRKRYCPAKWFKTFSKSTINYLSTTAIITRSRK